MQATGSRWNPIVDSRPDFHAMSEEQIGNYLDNYFEDVARACPGLKRRPFAGIDEAFDVLESGKLDLSAHSGFVMGLAFAAGRGFTYAPRSWKDKKLSAVKNLDKIEAVCFEVGDLSNGWSQFMAIPSENGIYKASDVVSLLESLNLARWRRTYGSDVGKKGKEVTRWSLLLTFRDYSAPNIGFKGCGKFPPNFEILGEYFCGGRTDAADGFKETADKPVSSPEGKDSH